MGVVNYILSWISGLRNWVHEWCHLQKYATLMRKKIVGEGGGMMKSLLETLLIMSLIRPSGGHLYTNGIWN